MLQTSIGFFLTNGSGKNIFQPNPKSNHVKKHLTISWSKIMIKQQGHLLGFLQFIDKQFFSIAV